MQGVHGSNARRVRDEHDGRNKVLYWFADTSRQGKNLHSPDEVQVHLGHAQEVQHGKVQADGYTYSS